MRITIGTRIFLALTVVSLVILTINAAVTRWNFGRGFLEYVAEQELATLTEIAAGLASTYRNEGGFDEFRHDPRRWREFLRRNSRPPGGPGSGPPHAPGRPPPDDPFDIERRVALLDAGGDVVIGRRDASGAERTMPVVVDDRTVGYVRISPQRHLTDRIDQEFAAEQERSIYLIALAALLLAALMSAWLARQLTRPIRSLAAAARAITGGDYGTRIPAIRDDELGDLAREFDTLASTLEKNRAARRQWVADIAHELRTPLAVLRGELDAIEDGIRTFDAASQRSLQDEVSRLMKLVGELHDLSVLDEGIQSYRFDALDPVAILEDVLRRAETRMADAGIALGRRLPDEPIAISGDATRLERVFTNLIENTLRYTAAPGRLEVRCTASDAGVVIEFADSAPAVPDAALGRLFDRLFRIDESRSRDTGGSGLGLAICKAIVAAHGGRIEAAASDLGGVLIRITLPLGAGQEARQ